MAGAGAAGSVPAAVGAVVVDAAAAAVATGASAGAEVVDPFAAVADTAGAGAAAAAAVPLEDDADIEDEEEGTARVDAPSAPALAAAFSFSCSFTCGGMSTSSKCGASAISSWVNWNSCGCSGDLSGMVVPGSRSSSKKGCMHASIDFRRLSGT